jgi:hypothetical protein
MNTSLICRFFAAVAACLGLAQAAVAHDPIAAETDSVWIFSDRYISTEHEFSEIAAQTDSVWIFSDRYISAEHEFSDLTSMIGSNTASTIIITTTPIVNIRMGSSKDVRNSARRVQEKKQGGREDAKRPVQPGRRTSTTSWALK